ncbi:MAG: phosphohydrolase [Chloroflexota bacterium]
MNAQIFEQARQYALQRLERELSTSLVYHSFMHTHEEVVPAAARLAQREGIQGTSLYLLLTAAWFHDLGFIEQITNNEAIGARIASEVLPSFGYTQEQVEVVQSAIMATALPQSPGNLLEAVLADADMDVLGSGNFLQRNVDLRRELAALGTEFTDIDWYLGQVKFVGDHRYFTHSARALRDRQKSLNVNKLKRLLAACAAAPA